MEKKWKTKVKGKVVEHGAKGYRIGKVGSDKWKSYCARSLGIAKKYPSARKVESPNYQSRRKWKCPVTKTYG
jgi:hypothetical protein